MKHTKKALATRKRIVDTAAQLIFTVGYSKTKLMDVLQAANVQKGNFYYYFTSKDELGLAVIRERGRQLVLDWLNTMIVPSADPWDNLSRMVTEIASVPENDGRPANPLANLAYEMGELSEEFRRELASIAEAVIEVFTGEFNRLATQGRLQMQAEPKVLAAFLFSSIVGALMHFRTAHNPTLLTECTRLALNATAQAANHA